jgi:gluconolactonase
MKSSVRGIVLSVVLFSVIFAGSAFGAVEKKVKSSSPVAKGERIEKLAGGFIFTEGPAADKEGNIYFSDIRNERIHKWSVEGKLSTFREKSGGANGLYFDRDGNMLACEGLNGRVVSIAPAGKVTVIADKYKGSGFNKPNDLWIDPKGGVYFTDPVYGKTVKKQEGERVYYLSPDRKKIICVINDMVRPNGLIGTPDGKVLYVADPGDQKVYSLKINDDATLSGKRLFAPYMCDGMTIDNKGNIYITEQKVLIFDSEGKEIGQIEIPEKPSNVTFGGADNKTLFITARTSLYSIKMKTRGGSEK